MTKSVPQALTDLGDLYRERSVLYKDNYMHFGKILMGLFPAGVTLKTEEEFNRFALFLQIVHKSSRYANAIKTGGHIDSLDDISVYSQMTQEYDGLMADARLKETLDKAYFDPEQGKMVDPKNPEYMGVDWAKLPQNEAAAPEQSNTLEKVYAAEPTEDDNRPLAVEP